MSGRPSRSCCYDAAVVMALLTGGLNIGLSMGILGPTLLDLALLTNVPLTTASTLATWRALTFTLGSLVSGVLLEYVEGYSGLAVVLLLQAVTTALSGWFSNFVLTCFFQAVSNLFATIMVSGVSFLAFRLERARARRLAQAAFLLFNVGKTVIPFIAAPFLAPESKTNSTTTMTPRATTNTMTTTPFSNHLVSGNVTSRQSIDFTSPPSWEVVTNFTGDQQAQPVTQVGWVYVIVGAFCLMMSFLYAGIAMAGGCKWRHVKEESRGSGEGVQEDGRPVPHGTVRMCVIIGVFLVGVFMQSGIESVENALLLTFVSQFMGRSKMTGIILTALYQGVKVIVCLAILFVVNRIHPSIILQADIVGMVAGSCVMTAGVVLDSDPIFFIAIVVMALGMSNYYATILSWLEGYYALTGRISGLITIAFGISAMALPPLTTAMTTTFGAVAFPAVLLVSSLLCAISWVGLKVALREPLCPPPNVITRSEVTETTGLLDEGEDTSQMPGYTENQPD